MLEKAELHPREGFWKAYGGLRLVERNRIISGYVEFIISRGYKLCRKAKKRLPARPKVNLVVPEKFYDTWSVDLRQDKLESGRKIRCFNVIDDASR